MGGQFFPNGMGDKVEGGYRVTGAWQFGSGTGHSEYVCAGFLPMDGGQMVMADAVMMLSNNWSDANAQWSTNTPLPAATATLSLVGSFMVGALPSTASRYGGGAERALRAMAPGRVDLYGTLAQPFTAVFSGPPGALASDTSGTTFVWQSILNVAVTRTTPTILLFAPGVSVPDRRRLCGYGGFNSYGGYGGYGGGYGGCG